MIPAGFETAKKTEDHEEAMGQKSQGVVADTNVRVGNTYAISAPHSANCAAQTPRTMSRGRVTQVKSRAGGRSENPQVPRRQWARMTPSRPSTIHSSRPRALPLSENASTSSSASSPVGSSSCLHDEEAANTSELNTIQTVCILKVAVYSPSSRFR